jgi:hypothetical protein
MLYRVHLAWVGFDLMTLALGTCDRNKLKKVSLTSDMCDILKTPMLCIFDTVDNPVSMKYIFHQIISKR